MVSHARIHRGPGNLEARIEKERMIIAGQIFIIMLVGWREEGEDRPGGELISRKESRERRLTGWYP